MELLYRLLGEPEPAQERTDELGALDGEVQPGGDEASSSQGRSDSSDRLDEPSRRRGEVGSLHGEVDRGCDQRLVRGVQHFVESVGEPCEAIVDPLDRLAHLSKPLHHVQEDRDGLQLEIADGRRVKVVALGGGRYPLTGDWVRIEE